MRTGRRPRRRPRALFDQAESDLKRYRQLAILAVSQQRQEQVLATEQQAKAAYDQAVADRAVAQLNLDRSEVYASVNGKISNMDLRPGTYVTAGKGVMALVDTDTLHVDGYFEETKLPHIQIGNRVARPTLPRSSRFRHREAPHKRSLALSDLARCPT